MAVDLRQLDDLVCHANGQVTLSGPLLQLEERLDRLFLAWAATCDAVAYRFPPLIDARALERIDYFHSFPHLATFPASLARDDHTLQAFADSTHLADDGAIRLGPLADTYDVLTPAACYPAYPHFRGARLAAPVRLTTRATCFRREARFDPLARQWAFAMREIVCLGRREEALAFVARGRAQVDRLAAALDLPLTWQEASDPFYGTPHTAAQQLQRLVPTKREMVFDGRLAIGSLNFHRRHFGEAFDIRVGDGAAYSACLAFGLERWLLAILERFGSHPSRWPDLEHLDVH